MVESWIAAISLVHIAAAVQIAGFLVRDQFLLRALILIGTILYIAYYYIEPDIPLWDAIACAVLMGAANLYTMMQLTLDRRPTLFAEEDLAVYRVLPRVSPGEFRRLVAIAERSTVSAPMEITREGTIPEYLYYLIEGNFTLDKKTRSQQLSAPTFLGEIAYMLNQPASATVTLDPGARYIRWKASDLKALASRNDLLGNALEFAFNRDLAAKVVMAG